MKDFDNIPAMMADLGARAKAASQELAFASAERKHAALIAAADDLNTSQEGVASAEARHTAAVKARLAAATRELAEQRSVAAAAVVTAEAERAAVQMWRTRCDWSSGGFGSSAAWLHRSRGGCTRYSSCRFGGSIADSD